MRSVNFPKLIPGPYRSGRWRPISVPSASPSFAAAATPNSGSSTWSHMGCMKTAKVFRQMPLAAGPLAVVTLWGVARRQPPDMIWDDSPIWYASWSAAYLTWWMAP